MYIHKLEPIATSPSMQFGKIFHSAFDMYYKGFTDAEVNKYLNDSFDELIALADPYSQETLIINKYIATGAWINFPRAWRGDFQEVTSEMSFRIPLIDDVEFVGRIDGLVRKDGVWLVRELKTTGLSFNAFERKANISSQVTGYVYAMKKMNVDVKGIIYDFIKKPLLRKGSNENVDQYGQRILMDYRARPMYYYHRYPTYRSDEDLNRYESDLIKLAHDVKRKLKDKEFYRNTNNCLNYNTECPYKRICFMDKPDKLTLQLYYKTRGDKHDEKKGAGEAGEKGKKE